MKFQVPISPVLLPLDLTSNIMKKTHFQDIVISLDLCSIVRNALFPKHLLETISGICLTLWVTEAVMLVTQLCPTVCNPLDYSPPGSSVHGILQERILM